MNQLSINDYHLIKAQNGFSGKILTKEKRNKLKFRKYTKKKVIEQNQSQNNIILFSKLTMKKNQKILKITKSCDSISPIV